MDAAFPVTKRGRQGPAPQVRPPAKTTRSGNYPRCDISLDVPVSTTLSRATYRETNDIGFSTAPKVWVLSDAHKHLLWS
jgi:hypothetical protein